MNIYTQVCGLIIIAILLLFYNRQPTMGMGSERKFKNTLYVILVCVLLDILSCYFIVNSSRYSTQAVIAVCKMYLVSLECVAVSALGYTVADTFEILGTKHEKILGLCYQGFFLIGVVITCLLHIEYYYDGHVLYTYGPATKATYLFVTIYILSLIASTALLKEYLKPKKISALFIWMGIWVLAAVIQYLKPNLLIVSFASCIGALIMYFELENPQGFISRKTGHFSSAVIKEYLEYLYLTKQHFSLMMISFKTNADSAEENKLLRKTIEMLSEFLFTVDNVKVFDTAEGYFLLTFPDTDFIESTKFKISTFINSVESNSNLSDAVTLLNPYYTIVPDGNIADSPDEMMLLLANFIPSEHNLLVGNETVVNEEIMETVRRQRSIERLVIDAMERHRIEVHYQPIYNIATKTFTSAEALVRIQMDDGSYLQPSEFIPIVELTGRIVPLSDEIYKKTLSFIKSYHIERIGVEHIELNLSVKQGESPVFTSKFLQLLTNYQIDPSLINLEITETSSLRSKENLYNNMRKLEDHGLSFSLDDFGSGSSNLNYIVDMPVNTVKLAKLLSEEYFENTKAQVIVKAVIEMAHSMGIKIIAQGIETAEEFETMKELGADYIQGFYFSKPLPEREFLKFMQNNNL